MYTDDKNYCPDCNGYDMCDACIAKWENDNPPCKVIDFFRWKYNREIRYIYKYDGGVQPGQPYKLRSTKCDML